MEYIAVDIACKETNSEKRGPQKGSVANFSNYQINSVCWTQLSRESRKLLEWALTRCVKLLLSDHMCDFDTIQCCRC